MQLYIRLIARALWAQRIAKDIRATFPEVYIKYRKAYEAGPLALGQVLYVQAATFGIYNICGQDRYGRDKRYTDHKAVETCMYKVIQHAKAKGFKSIGVPYKMGCNLGGGDWNTVKSILERTAEDIDIVIHHKPKEAK